MRKVSWSPHKWQDNLRWRISTLSLSPADSRRQHSSTDKVSLFIQHLRDKAWRKTCETQIKKSQLSFTPHHLRVSGSRWSLLEDRLYSVRELEHWPLCDNLNPYFSYLSCFHVSIPLQQFLPGTSLFVSCCLIAKKKNTSPGETEYPPTYNGFSVRGGRCQSHVDEKSNLASQQRSTVVCSTPGTGGYILTNLHRRFRVENAWMALLSPSPPPGSQGW